MSPVLPIALAYAAFALVCVRQVSRTIALGWGVVAALALGVAYLARPIAGEWAFTVCWATVLAAAGTAIAISAPSRAILLFLAGATGMATGLVAASAAQILPLIEAAPGAAVLLVAVLHRWQGLTLLIRIAAAWMIAVALLSVAIPLVTTPGYRSDHRE